MTDTPLPGSPEARALGCTCPREQPRAFHGMYWRNGGCPVHDAPAAITEVASPLHIEEAQ